MFTMCDPTPHAHNTPTTQAWGPGHLVAYEAGPADGGAGGRLVKARIHRLEAPVSSTATDLRSGHRSQTGGCECLSPSPPDGVGISFVHYGFRHYNQMQAFSIPDPSSLATCGR